MIPSYFRKSRKHKVAFATMEFLVEHDPVGPITKGAAPDRGVLKAAVDRHKSILEHGFSDKMADYFREERAQVVESARRGADERLVGLVLDSMGEDLRDAYEDAFWKAATEWGVWAARKAGIETKASGYDDQIVDWLRRNAGKKIADITEATRKKIAEQIKRGLGAGEGPAAIARRIDKFYLESIIPDRSMTIARTEVAAATNWIQHFIAETADVPMEKEWLSLSDSRVRDDHAEANGQVRPLDEPFNVGGDLLMFPGDPSGSPEEVINCRCSVLHHVVEPSPPHKSAAPSPAEFARDVVGIENADVAVAMAYMKGVFTDEDEWTHARRVLMKHVHRLRRVAKYDPSEPRDDRGRWTDSGGSPGGVVGVYSAEGRQKAEAQRKWANGTVVRYTGGSKVKLNVGEHLTVRGVWGMNEKGGNVYYHVQTGNGRKMTLSDKYLRVPEAHETPAEPHSLEPKKPSEAPSPSPAPPRPTSPAAPPPPRPLRPSPPSGPVSPATWTGPRPPAADYLAPGASAEKITQTFERRWPGKRLFITSKRVKTREVATMMADLDRNMEAYPVGAEHLKSVHVDPQLELRESAGRGSQAYWHPLFREIHIGDAIVNDGDDDFDKRYQVSQGWHPEGCVTTRYSMNHEFGHCIDYAIRSGRGPTDPLRQRWAQFNEDHLTNMMTVSGYALSAYQKRHNNDEGVAESFGQLAEHESGRWAGRLRPGAQALKDFFSDTSNRAAGGMKATPEDRAPRYFFGGNK